MKKEFVQRGIPLFLTAIILVTMLSGVAMADTKTNLCEGIAAPILNMAATSGTTDEEKLQQKELQAAALIDGAYANGNSNSSWALRADWHYSQSNPPTATFDLGTAKKVGQWVITGASSYTDMIPVNFDIQYSTDGTNWQTVAEVRGNTEFTCTTTFANVEAQYWKLIIKFESRTSGVWSRITEIEMYEGEDFVEDIEVPQIAVVEPANLTQLYEGETLSLSAQATCETAEIESVGFYANGTLIASAAVDGTDGLWKANADNITAGEYVLTAKAVTVKGGEAESESVRVRVHSENYTNIALGKKVTASPAKSAEANPDALVDGVNNITTGEYRWYANASQANGAYAEIDLDCGFGNMFLLRSIKLYSGYTSGTEYMSDFTLYYHNGETWIEAVAVSANTQVTYTYVFPSEVKASAVKLVSAQSAVFRVRELEVLGKLDDTKLSKTATVVTDDAGDEIKILQQDMVVRAEAEITNADTEENGNVDVLALLAVKDSNDKLLSANALSKTVGIGTTEAFELTATIPEGNEVYCEVFWFDAHTLAPLFPKNTIKSKVQKYSSDEVVVSVTSEGFDVYVKGSDIYGTDYIQYPFKHIKSESMNADLYRIYYAYAVERTGDTSFTKTFSAPLLNMGELEFAVRELVDGVAAEDFIGGFHGDENLTSVSLMVDGTEINLNSTGFYKGSTVKFVQDSTLNKCGQPEAIAANHTKSYTIDKDGVKLDQTVDWVDSIILDECYPCMFPVYRTDGATQVTDFVTYQLNGQEVIYDTRDNQTYYMTPTADIFAATIYSASNGYSATVKYIPGEGLDDHRFSFQVRPVGDTKVYFRSNKGKTTAKGEHWEWTNLYKLDLK